eukprot:Seg1716.13 transcript_id=Seg1716.13/GoldUCD/mRNA.D3Y31 product="hypothetical protein" protein_id=Seg1716.13/GoldUCD/D3Y31
MAEHSLRVIENVLKGMEEIKAKQEETKRKQGDALTRISNMKNSLDLLKKDIEKVSSKQDSLDLRVDDLERKGFVIDEQIVDLDYDVARQEQFTRCFARIP